MTSGVEGMGGPSENALYRLASAAGLLFGAFLLMAAYGHFEAVRDALTESMTAPAKRFALTLPGLMLVATGLANIAVCRALWRGADWALHIALVGNVISASYLAYLMISELPGHPVGEFLALVCCHIVVLVGIRAGLVWPARGP